jgi:hypothetical protein
MHMVNSERAGRVWVRSCCALAVVILLGPTAASGQWNTRLLLQSGWGVPGHPGFAFGPFSSLAMNQMGEIAFLTTLTSPKSEIRAVVRSMGVTFSVVAFEGLRSPVPNATYDSFSAPSLSDAGILTFSATLKNQVMMSAVIRLEGTAARVVALSGTSVPEKPDATFLEFSPPLINSAGKHPVRSAHRGKGSGNGFVLVDAARNSIRVVASGDEAEARRLIEACLLRSRCGGFRFSSNIARYSHGTVFSGRGIEKFRRINTPTQAFGNH